MTLFDLVERERRGVARQLTVGGAALVITAVLAVLLVATLALGDSRWLSLPRVAPFIGWVIAIGAMISGIRWLVARLGRETSVARIAGAVEEERKMRAGSVRGALEVADVGVLGRLNATQVADHLIVMRGGTLAPELRRRVARRAALGGLAASVGILALFSAASAAPDGWRAMLHPLSAWNGTLLGGVTLSDAPRSVLRGEKVKFTVRAPGRRMITLAQRVTGSSWRSTSLALAGDSATVSLGPLDADLVVYATDGRSTSDTMSVEVVDRPFIGDVSVRATFPGYLSRKPETIPLGELVRVPRGTVMTIAGHSSTELASVVLATAGVRIPLQVTARAFSGQVTAASSGTYSWSAAGRNGAIGDLPPSLQLEVLPDSAPMVEILSPGRDSLVNAQDTIGVSVLATDDHGLSAASIRITIVNNRGDVRVSTVKSLGGAQGEQFQGQLSISMSALTPGDAMKLVAIATDASPWRQTGTSAELVLRLPSLSEQRDAVRAAADSTVAKAMATANAQKQLNQRTADAARARQREQPKAGKDGKDGKDAMSYEASEQAKQFAKEQRQLADRMQQLQQAAKDLEKQLKQAGALDSSLQERLREAQKLLREALTPELQEKLRKLEQASQNMSPEESKRALQDLSEQQRKLREQLEKSVEMLKRAALEGQMETLKDEAKELAKKQRDLVDSLRTADRQDEKNAAQQMAKELTDRAKNLQDDVKKLQERLKKEKAEAGAERVREANEKIDESLEKLQQAMKDAQKQQGSQGEKQDGQSKDGQKQDGQKQDGQSKDGQKQDGQKGGEQKPGEQGQKGGEKEQNAQQGAAAKDGQQQSQSKTGPGQQGTQKGEQQTNEGSAEQAAQAMEEASNELSKAREQQVGEWKKELTGEMDRSIQEMLQLAREQDNLEQQARRGTAPGELRSQQSALQQGVDKTMQRLQQAGTKSNLLSQRSMRMMSDARRKVEEATSQTQRAQTGQQMASAMREAGEALNQAGASLVRDREKTQQSESSTGFAEMLEQLQQMARQQQSLNSAAQELMPKPGQNMNSDAQNASRQLAKQQRELAAKLEENGDRDDSGRADEMAREARQIAQQLESANLDASVLERQQRLFRKMLDAGRLLEEDQREDTGKREAKSWSGSEVFTPSGANASGKSASKFLAPTWNELRGLTPEERRLVLEYFKRINGKP